MAAIYAIAPLVERYAGEIRLQSVPNRLNEGAKVKELGSTWQAGML